MLQQKYFCDSCKDEINIDAKKTYASSIKFEIEKIKKSSVDTKSFKGDFCDHCVCSFEEFFKEWLGVKK